MRYISETSAIEKLKSLKAEFAGRIRQDYEHRAKSCAACETPGSCCLDEHFVNVRVTRLEAKLISMVIELLPTEKQVVIHKRTAETVAKYGLSRTDAEMNGENDAEPPTYACPLFEKGTGCLVHGEAKPLPCIMHACYERAEDIPPEHLLAEQEAAVHRLNRMVYGNSASGGFSGLLPLPVRLVWE